MLTVRMVWSVVPITAAVELFKVLMIVVKNKQHVVMEVTRVALVETAMRGKGTVTRTVTAWPGWSVAQTTVKEIPIRALTTAANHQIVLVVTHVVTVTVV